MWRQCTEGPLSEAAGIVSGGGLLTATLAMNDIAHVTLNLAQPIFDDTYTNNRATGAFILIDETSNQTVAAGMIEAEQP